MAAKNQRTKRTTPPRQKAAGASRRTSAPTTGASDAVQPFAGRGGESALPLATTIPGAMALSGLSRSAIYRGWNAGKIEFRKAGRTTLVVTESVRRYVAELPASEPRQRQSPTS